MDQAQTYRLTLLLTQRPFSRLMNRCSFRLIVQLLVEIDLHCVRLDIDFGAVRGRDSR